MALGTTSAGYVNRHGQVVEGASDRASNHYNQKAYELRCKHCEQLYGANGCDIHIRRCPYCQQGQPGL